MPRSLPTQPPCGGDHEQALNLFLDGELPTGELAVLFAHLATCEGCRIRFEAVIRFRRMSRQESLVVPPGIDEAFFQRLARVKARKKARTRQPVSPLHLSVPLYLTVVLVLMMFLVGMFLDKSFQDERARSIQPAPATPALTPAVYPAENLLFMIYPGPTVEAERGETTAAAPRGG